MEAAGSKVKKSRGRPRRIFMFRAQESRRDPDISRKIDEIKKRQKRRRIAFMNNGTGSFLTDRQSEVAFLIMCEMNSLEIASRLGIGLDTVKGLIEEMYERFGARSRVGFIISATASGAIEIDDIEFANDCVCYANSVE